MADELEWPIEFIPDADSVFMRAHRQHFETGSLAPGVFKPQGGGLSVNWEKYASAEQTRQQGTRPDENAVLRLSVRGIRTLRDTDPLTVEHTPLPENRAHTDVNGIPGKGEERTEIRVLLLRLAGPPVIPLPHKS